MSDKKLKFYGSTFGLNRVPGLLALYDFGDINTMYADTARTTPATVGGTVAGVTDLSGNGNHATQAVSGSRPILRQGDLLNGSLYSLDFITSKALELPAMLGATNTTASILIYYRSYGYQTGNYNYLWHACNTGNTRYRSGYVYGASHLVVFEQYGFFDQSTIVGDLNPHLFAWRWGGNHCYMNKDSLKYDLSRTTSALDLSAQFCIGAVGTGTPGSYTASRYANGRYFLVAVYNRELSDAEMI